MRLVHETNELNGLLDHYAECYKERYKVSPIEANSVEQEALKYVLRRVKNYDLVRGMVETYLRLTGQKRDDMWFVQQGHDLLTFKNKLTFLYAHTADQKTEQVQYVVGLTETGFPIIATQAKAVINGFLPMELNKWLHLPEDRKFVLPEGRWKNVGADTTVWKRTWKEEGFNK